MDHACMVQQHGAMKLAAEVFLFPFSFFLSPFSNFLVYHDTQHQSVNISLILLLVTKKDVSPVTLFTCTLDLYVFVG